jgi:phosphoribosylformimino-5-aminoimidazole carboxamide ribotide isomerase
MKALKAYPQGMQIGGGITADNALEYIEAGASHVIVTSYVFQNGEINWDNLKRLVEVAGKEKIVLDLSCRKKDDRYYVVTDRWQKLTEQKLDEKLLETLSGYCDEFLIHAVDVEGKANGIETNLVSSLGSWPGIPITYAGGVHSYEDIRLLKELGKGRMNVTVGSALDLFGGKLEWRKIQEMCK